MNHVMVEDSNNEKNLVELSELCRVAGAAGSTVISSSDKVIIFYTDPMNNGIHAGDFVDELHIQHQKNAHVLIAVFPVD